MEKGAAMAVKITFPNRPCPKCGKPIHIKSKSHPECGWTAASSAVAKGSPAKAEVSNGKPKNKMEAVRRVLAESGNDTKPLDIQGQLQKNFKITMDTATISTYKGTILRQGARKKLGRPKRRHFGAVMSSSSNSISIEDIKAVKDLAERLGAEKLRQLAEVLVK
jgi:hypothetical protein